MPAEDKIFSRLNEIHHDLSGQIQEIGERMAAEHAKCELCRPIVMGNGHDSMGVRMDRAERWIATRSKWEWLILGSFVSGLTVAVNWIPKVFHWF